jgi:hypothetical protein
LRSRCRCVKEQQQQQRQSGSRERAVQDHRSNCSSIMNSELIGHRHPCVSPAPSHASHDAVTHNCIGYHTVQMQTRAPTRGNACKEGRRVTHMYDMVSAQLLEALRQLQQKVSCCCLRYAAVPLDVCAQITASAKLQHKEETTTLLLFECACAGTACSSSVE